MALGISGKKLDEIIGNCNKTTDCLNRVITIWVEQSYDTERFKLPSWKTMCGASSKVSDDKKFIKDLALEHGGKPRIV